ncbi:MAG: hypothetical protein ACK5HP_01390 [Bacilli bacterium]
MVRYYADCSLNDQLRKEIKNTTTEMYFELRNLKGNLNNAPEEVKNILYALNYLSSLYKEEIKEDQEKAFEQDSKNYSKILTKLK